MTRLDFIDLLIILFWCYGNGYLFAWFLASFRLDAHLTGILFTFIGWILGLIGLGVRRRRGKFPFVLALIIWPLPFLCTFVGSVWWAIEIVQRWLGIG